MVSHFNLSSSHQAVVKQSWGSRQAVVRQSSGSHQAISRQYSGSRQAVIRQSQSSNTHPRVLFQVPPIKSQHLPSIAQPVRYWRPFKPSRFFKKKKKKIRILKKIDLYQVIGFFKSCDFFSILSLIEFCSLKLFTFIGWNEEKAVVLGRPIESHSFIRVHSRFEFLVGHSNLTSEME